MQTTLEIILVSLIIIIQIYFFWITLKQIRTLSSIFPEPNEMKITRLQLLRSDVESHSPAQILQDIPGFQKRARASDNPGELVSLGLLLTGRNNPVYQEVTKTINSYLLRNSGMVPDFNLIKDIADRNSDAVEEQVGTTISIPLYLGLLGTLLGIIFGLFNISNLRFFETDLSRNAMLDITIPALLGGVKIAMIASFMGLLLTVAHFGHFFRTAKAANVRNKLAFFSYLQSELLPLLHQNLNDTLYSLQANLISFNKDFGENVGRLKGLMNKNYDALIAQEHVMEMLSKMDIMELTTANVQTLAQLQTAIRNFGEFNEYVGSVNQALQRTDIVIERMDTMIGRTETLDQLGHRAVTIFEMNQELMRFLKAHFNELDSSKQMISRGVVDVNEHLSNALDDLKSFTHEKLQSIRKIEIEQVDFMSKTYEDRWKSIVSPAEMLEAVRLLNNHSHQQSQEIESLSGSIHRLQEVVAQMDEHMERRAKDQTMARETFWTRFFHRKNHVNETN
jgi:hypothetical protein